MIYIQFVRVTTSRGICWTIIVRSTAKMTEITIIVVMTISGGGRQYYGIVGSGF